MNKTRQSCRLVVDVRFGSFYGVNLLNLSILYAFIGTTISQQKLWRITSHSDGIWFMHSIIRNPAVSWVPYLQFSLILRKTTELWVFVQFLKGFILLLKGIESFCFVWWQERASWVFIHFFKWKNTEGTEMFLTKENVDNSTKLFCIANIFNKFQTTDKFKCIQVTYRWRHYLANNRVSDK